MNSCRLVAGALAFFSLSCVESSPTSSSARIVEAGWSFGFCIGPCRGELGLDGESLSLRLTDRTGGQIFATNRGRLTSRGSARLAGLAEVLPVDLLEQYGCPDCADGGASFVTVVRESETRRTEYEYGNPPPGLAATDELLASLMEALRHCRETSDVTLESGCTPVP